MFYLVEEGPLRRQQLRSIQGGKSETSVLLILPCTPFVLLSYSLGTPLVLPHTSLYSLVLPRTPLYSPRTSLVLPRTSSCFLVLPRTSWYSLVLPRTPSYSLRTSFVLREYGSLAFPPLFHVYMSYRFFLVDTMNHMKKLKIFLFRLYM